MFRSCFGRCLMQNPLLRSQRACFPMKLVLSWLKRFRNHVANIIRLLLTLRGLTRLGEPHKKPTILYRPPWHRAPEYQSKRSSMAHRGIGQLNTIQTILYGPLWHRATQYHPNSTQLPEVGWTPASNVAPALPSLCFLDFVLSNHLLLWRKPERPHRSRFKSIVQCCLTPLSTIIIAHKVLSPSYPWMANNDSDAFLCFYLATI